MKYRNSQLSLLYPFMDRGEERCTIRIEYSSVCLLPHKALNRLDEIGDEASISRTITDIGRFANNLFHTHFNRSFSDHVEKGISYWKLWKLVKLILQISHTQVIPIPTYLYLDAMVRVFHEIDNIDFIFPLASYYCINEHNNYVQNKDA